MDTSTVPARAAALAGALATVGVVGVVAGEVTIGTDFMETTAAQLLGWCGFAAACALVLGVAGLRDHLTDAREQGWAAVLLLGTAATTGAAATLALVVPALAERAPDVATDPPAAVPATFILSGVVMGISGIAMTLRIRSAVPSLPRPVFLLMLVGSVVAILPLPSRFFLLAFGIAALLGHLGTVHGTHLTSGARVHPDTAGTLAP
ncbi:hypothetical protein [Nocardioides caldifontis]|uniref:hypothetical protein n=1 Tax=Nocardioides caldifontis TaxID=2588938 RepID=UPI0011DFA38F|nr:hypothetical protein [Nocardioides caldifontis]